MCAYYAPTIMNKFFNYFIAMLLPAMVSCNNKKVQEVPEDMYGCPMPDVEWEDEPEDAPAIEIDVNETTK